MRIARDVLLDVKVAGPPLLSPVGAVWRDTSHRVDDRAHPAVQLASTSLTRRRLMVTKCRRLNMSWDACWLISRVGSYLGAGPGRTPICNACVLPLRVLAPQTSSGRHERSIPGRLQMYGHGLEHCASDVEPVPASDAHNAARPPQTSHGPRRARGKTATSSGRRPGEILCSAGTAGMGHDGCGYSWGSLTCVFSVCHSAPWVVGGQGEDEGCPARAGHPMEPLGGMLSEL